MTEREVQSFARRALYRTRTLYKLLRLLRDGAALARAEEEARVAELRARLRRDPTSLSQRDLEDVEAWP